MSLVLRIDYEAGCAFLPDVDRSVPTSTVRAGSSKVETTSAFCSPLGCLGCTDLDALLGPLRFRDENG